MKSFSFSRGARVILWGSLACVLALLGGCRPLSAPPPAYNPAASAPDSPTATPQAEEPQPKSSSPTSSLALVPIFSGGRSYNIGSVILNELYVSPSGDDSATGASPDQALRTLTAAWERIPANTAGTGYRIDLLPGIYPCEPGPEESNCINFFSAKAGSAQYPILIQAVNGPGSVTLRGGLNFSAVAYLYLIDLNLVGGGSLPTNSSGNNLLHIDSSEHVLLRGLSVLGPDCPNDTCNNLQEVFKVNQTSYLYVEDSTFGGAWHSVVDYFVVQYGHFINNTLHTAGQWCMYIKGGSAYLNIEGNELHDCQLGFQSGQAANLAVMRSPWFHYETYAIRFVNNILHDIPGVGLSAAGAYNSLFAYNTLVRVGTSSDPGYPLIQLVYGERNCTPIDEIPNVIANCTLFTNQGAWGPTSQTEGLPAIPNRRVFVVNNLIYNPGPSQTLYSHFNIPGPLSVPAGFVNIPNPILADQEILIAGNLIWNGPADLPLGIEDAGQGCQPSNTSCNAAQLTSQNLINQFEPQLANAAGGDFHPSAGGNVFGAPLYAVPDFTWNSFSPAVPVGQLQNSVPVDRDGSPRGPSSPPGAYAEGR